MADILSFLYSGLLGPLLFFPDAFNGDFVRSFPKKSRLLQANLSPM